MNYCKLVMMGAGIAGAMVLSTNVQAQTVPLELHGEPSVAFTYPTVRNVGSVVGVQIIIRVKNYDNFAVGSTLTQTKDVALSPAFMCSEQRINNGIFGADQTNKMGARNAVSATNATIEGLKITSCRGPRMNSFPETQGGLVTIGLKFNAKITSKADIDPRNNLGTVNITYDTNPKGGSPRTATIAGVQ